MKVGDDAATADMLRRDHRGIGACYVCRQAALVAASRIEMPTVSPVEGLTVAGKYLLVRPIARGSMGEVWVARHATLGREVAIKFLSRQSISDGEDDRSAMARFQFEAQVAAHLSRRSRHIVLVSDYGVEWGYAYLVMELIEGESLERRLVRQPMCDIRPLAVIVRQVAKGLAVAHAEGLFHRDLKPANILLTADEEGHVLAKILDFGIAKAARAHAIPREGNFEVTLGGGALAVNPCANRVGHQTEDGVVLGTPSYMSPEQARGLSTLDGRCDLWALATIAFEALSGRLPFDGETTADLLVNVCTAPPLPIRRLRPDLPPSIDAFFSRAFAPWVDKRFQDAATLAAELSAIAEEVEGIYEEMAAADGVTAGEERRPGSVSSRAITRAGAPVMSLPMGPRVRRGFWAGVVLAIAAFALALALRRASTTAAPIEPMAGPTPSPSPPDPPDPPNPANPLGSLSPRPPPPPLAAIFPGGESPRPSVAPPQGPAPIRRPLSTRDAIPRSAAGGHTTPGGASSATPPVETRTPPRVAPSAVNPIDKSEIL